MHLNKRVICVFITGRKYFFLTFGVSESGTLTPTENTPLFVIIYSYIKQLK